MLDFLINFTINPLNLTQRDTAANKNTIRNPILA